MAGRIKFLINDIIEKRSGGSAAIAHLTMAKLIMKGIDPENFDDSSPDDPSIIRELELVAIELGITL